MNRNKFISYTQSFLSFVFSDDTLWKNGSIKNIILFGSVARGDFTEKSDIDIFFEVSDKNRIIFVRKRIEYILSQFLSSQIYKGWVLRGIKNEIKPLVNTLKSISDLDRSLIADGIVLFGEFFKDIKLKHFILFSFKPIQKKDKKYRIDRYLFGRTERKKAGFVQRVGGTKISSRTFILPALQASDVIKKLKRENIKFIMHDIWLE